jgi:hypothetical protein
LQFKANVGENPISTSLSATLVGGFVQLWAAYHSPPGAAARAGAGKGKKGTAVRGTRGWDAAMERARAQAERDVRARPPSDGNPPFVIVVDVGHTIELYAEFTRLGKNYTPFPDPRTHRIALADLAKPETRERLAAAWTDPLSLDPARRTAKVTREIAAHLAALAKSFDTSGQGRITGARSPVLRRFILKPCLPGQGIRAPFFVV